MMGRQAAVLILSLMVLTGCSLSSVAPDRPLSQSEIVALVEKQAPAPAGEPYAAINRNQPFFTKEENWTAENDGALDKVYHQTVKKVTQDYESLGFNTAISQMMIFVNACYKNGSCPRAYAESFIQMLSCVCPHIGEEMWQILGHEESLALAPWPTWDEEKMKEETIKIPVQVNGKVRGTVEIIPDEGEETVLEKALGMKNVQAATEGKTLVKKIYVRGRIVNLVVK